MWPAGWGGDSLGQDTVAFGRGEVLQLQGVLGEESHGQVEIVVPKLRWKHRDECQAGWHSGLRTGLGPLLIPLA